MFIYIAILIILLMLGIVEIWFQEKRISWVIGSGLAVFAGLRYYTGYDYINYQRNYYRIQSVSSVIDNTTFEPGYLLANFSFTQIGFGYQTFVLVLSLISLSLLTWYLYKYFPYPSLALTYYYARFYHLRDMAQVRSALASIILLFGIPYLVEKKFWKFFLIVFLASMFHSGSFVFLGVYLLHIILEKLTIRNVLVLVGLAIFFGLLIQYPELYESFVPNRYISYVIAPSRMGGPWYTNPIVLMQLIIFSSGLWLIKLSSNIENDYLDVVLKIYLFASLALIASNTLRVLGGRVSTFFATVEILIVPYIMLHLTKNKLVNLLSFILFTSFIFYLIFIFSGRFYPYIPYRTIFSN